FGWEWTYGGEIRGAHKLLVTNRPPIMWHPAVRLSRVARILHARSTVYADACHDLLPRNDRPSSISAEAIAARGPGIFARRSSGSESKSRLLSRCGRTVAVDRSSAVVAGTVARVCRASGITNLDRSRGRPRGRLRGTGTSAREQRRDRLLR